MAEQITNFQYTIEEAFKHCFYVVPDYQREYVWQEKQIHQLLGDIDDQFDNGGSQYFIGTILVSKQKDDGKIFDIIDGQQRLTTIFLVLCALRVLLKGTEHERIVDNLLADSRTLPDGRIEHRFKLSPRYENANEIMEKIVEINDIPKYVRTEIESSGIRIYGALKNILDAYDIIFKFLSDNYNSKNELIRYWGYLSSRIIFIQISTDISSALKIFETINERGVGLNPMDLLKNLLFTQVKEEKFTLIKDEWKKITSPLEENKEKPLRFLRYFLMANYKIEDGRNDDAVIRENEIYDWLLRKNNVQLTQYDKLPFDFIRKIIGDVKHYINFSNSCGNDGKLNMAMSSLKRLTGEGFSLHYVLLLAAANLPKPLFDHFVVQLESFLFFYIFTKTPSKYLERNFSIWADEIREISQSNDEILQRQKLNDFVDKNFKGNMDKKAPELEDALNRMNFNSMQKYRIRYLLCRLTEHVEMAFQGQSNRTNFDNYFNLEIEHILPSTPEEELLTSWQNRHPDDVPYNEAKDRLGNLCLLEKPINIVASNDFYEKKLPEYAKSGNYLTRSLSGLAPVGENTSISRINEKLSSFDKWDYDDIEKRQSILVKLVLDICKTSNIKT